MAVEIFTKPDMPLSTLRHTPFTAPDSFGAKLVALQERVARIEKRKGDLLNQLKDVEAALRVAEEKIAAHQHRDSLLRQEVGTFDGQILQRRAVIQREYTSFQPEDARILARAQKVRRDWDASNARITAFINEMYRCVS